MKARRHTRCRLALEAIERRLAPAAVFTVNSILDTDDGQPFDPAGVTTLRKALRLANADADLDTIQFAKSLDDKTILPTGGELAITRSVVINGLGSDRLTIDAHQASRIFNIDDGTSAQIGVAISGLRLTDGKADDGDPGTTTLADSGGAILSREFIKLTGCVFDHNAAASFGGAINNIGGGSLTLVKTIVSGNTALKLGGGVSNAFGGTVVVANSTFVDNTSAGGARFTTTALH